MEVSDPSLWFMVSHILRADLLLHGSLGNHTDSLSMLFFFSVLFATL